MERIMYKNIYAQLQLRKWIWLQTITNKNIRNKIKLYLCFICYRNSMLTWNIVGKYLGVSLFFATRICKYAISCSTERSSNLALFLKMQITKRYRKSYFNTMAITLTISCVYINMKHTAQPARETDSNLVISFTGRNNAIVQVYNDLRLTLDLFILTKIRLRNVGQLSIDSSISHHAIGSLDAILHGMMPNVFV